VSLDDPWDCRRYGRHKPVGPSVASHRRRAAASGSRTTARSSSCQARVSLRHLAAGHPEPVDIAVHHGQSAAGHARAYSVICIELNALTQTVGLAARS
jgi:hypothetical protein